MHPIVFGFYLLNAFTNGQKTEPSNSNFAGEASEIQFIRHLISVYE